MYLAPATSQQDSISCVPESTRHGVNQCTAGGKDPSAYSLRKAVGDFSGGMSYIQMTEATPKAAGVQSWAKYGIEPVDAKAIVEAGHPTVWSIDTAVTRPYSIRTCYCNIGHSIHIPAGAFTVFQPDGDRCTCEKRITTRHGEYTMQDPGTSAGYRRISASLLYKAALTRAGNGGVNILVLPDVTHVRRRAKSTATGSIRARADGSSRSRGSIVPGRRYDIARPVRGTRYRIGSRYAHGWFELEDAKGFIRADKLNVVNV